MIPIRAIALMLLVCIGSTAPLVFAGELPLPRDSVYNLTATLTDQSGRAVPWATQRGRPRVVSMFYTSCPYMCPLIVDGAKAVEHALTAQERARIGITLISMDPRRDTPAALTALGAKRKLEWNRWTLLRPSAKDVRPLAGLLGIRYRALANGEFNHSSALLLLDAQGRIVARTEKVGTSLDPEFLKAVHRTLGTNPPTS